MISTILYLCAIPPAAWWVEGDTAGRALAIGGFAADALSIERRIAKGVNRENERMRYNLCCARIEAAIPMGLLTLTQTSSDFRDVLAAGRLPVIALGNEYMDAVAEISAKYPDAAVENRVAASFYPPGSIELQNRIFFELAREVGRGDDEQIRRRTAFFERARRAECGVVILQDAYNFQVGQVEAINSPAVDRQMSDRPADSSWLVEEREYSENEGRALRDILQEQVADAIRTARGGRAAAINFSNQPHNVITEVLRDFVYMVPGDQGGPVQLQVIYTDGSQADPILLRCLPLRPTPDALLLGGIPPLRVALMSMRHLEMDSAIDIAWLRNSEVSKSRTLAETDRFCYEQSQRQLQDTALQENARIYLYQTGFQPAVIGFYRALVETLRARAGRQPILEITPFYFSRHQGYRPGRPWY